MSSMTGNGWDLSHRWRAQSATDNNHPATPAGVGDDLRANARSARYYIRLWPEGHEHHALMAADLLVREELADKWDSMSPAEQVEAAFQLPPWPSAAEAEEASRLRGVSDIQLTVRGEAREHARSRL